MTRISRLFDLSWKKSLKPRLFMLARIFSLALVLALAFSALGATPVEAISNGMPASLVLGQPGFTSNTSATTQSGMNYPHSVAVDPTTGKVFVVEYNNNRVLRFLSLASLTNGASAEAVLGQSNFTSNGPATAQNRMRLPTGVSVDSAGRLWVADRGNHRVLRFDSAASKTNGANADGVLGQANFTSNTAATTQSRMNYPTFLFADSAGNLWVGDNGNNRVLRFDSAASKANGATANGVLGQANFTSNTAATTQNRMNNVRAVYVDTNGTLWVGDYLNNRVLRFDSAASKANGANADGVLGQANFTSNTAATTQSGMNRPDGLSGNAAGQLFVADRNNVRILVFDNADGKANGASADYVLGQANFTSNTTATTASGLLSPSGLFFDGSTQVLWAADTTNHRVLMYDLQPPTITSATSTTLDGSYNVPDAINITLNFSESISSAGLTINLNSGGSVTTGALANVTSYSGTYTVATGHNTADLTVSSITGTITDAATNNTTDPTVPAGQNIAVSKDIVIDTAAPTLNSFARQTPATSPTNADTLVFRATFNEDVQNVNAADFAVTGTTATISGVAGVGAGPNYSEYDITVTGGDLPGLNGTVGLDLAGGQNITDLVGNALPAGEPATDETYVVNNTAPSLTSFTRQTPATSPTNADTLVFRATFSVDIQNVDAADFTVTGTTATITGVAGVGAGPNYSEYDITVSGGDLAGLNGTVGLDLAGGQNITDLVGNALPAGEPATDETYVVNNTAPSLTSFTRQTPATSPTNADTLVFRATFSVDVQNVDAADFTVTGTTATISGVAAVGAGPNYSEYDITVTGGDLAGLNGTVGLNLAGGQNIQDLAGNALPAGEPATDETYEVNNTYPTAAGVNPTNSSVLFVGPTQIIVEFNEAVLADGSANAADLPANYLLVEDGGNSAFDTTACGGAGGGLQPDDVQITVDSVNYDDNGGAGPFQATLDINGSVPLPIGVYRLFICGTSSIYDPAGNRLNNGADNTIDFTVSAPAPGGAGGAGGGSAALTLPRTGFAPGVVTLLPPQTTTYAKLGSLWLEIPSLNVKANIVGVPQSENAWDVKWLGQDVGWLNSTAFPTWEGNSVLTAHVTDANGKAGPFANLKDLKYGAQVIVHLYDQQYVFEVRNKRLVRPETTAFAFQHLEDHSYLTIITCQDYDAATNSYRYRRVIRSVLVEVK